MAREQADGDDRVRRQLAQERQRMRTAEAVARRSQQEIAALRSRLRRADAEARSLRVQREATELELLLLRGLGRSPVFDWDAYQRRDEPPALDLGADARALPVPVWAAFEPVESGPLGTIVATLPGAERLRQRRMAAAKQRYGRAREDYERTESERRERVGRRESEHREQVEAHRRGVEEHNRGWRELHEGVRARDPACVARLLRFVLAHLPMPAGFPREAEVSCSPGAEQARVRAELPTSDVVPKDVGYTASAELDEPEKLRRTPEEIAALHRSVVGQVALLQLRELFGVDPQLQRVQLTGHTGDGAELLAVDADRAAFDGLGLGVVLDPAACLRALGGAVRA